MATKARSRVYRGETLTLVDTIAGAGSIAGWHLLFSIRKQKGVGSAFLTLVTGAGISIADPVNRIVNIQLTAAQTFALLVGTWAWDLWRTDSGGEACLTDGTLTVSQPARDQASQFTGGLDYSQAANSMYLPLVPAV